MKNLALIFTLFFSLATMAQKELPTVTLTTLEGDRLQAFKKRPIKTG